MSRTYAPFRDPVGAVKVFGRSVASIIRVTGLVEQLPDFPRRELVDGVHQHFLTERIDVERSEDDVPNHELVAV